jgi:FkbM family methyltransferase|tara:strand:+ start:254 stop:979 length:726 start_codon:yes stop_codon:yes gene_type:complete
VDTYDYYGWDISDKTPLYKKLLEQNSNIVEEDYDAIDRLINQFVKNKSVALDIGCHYGFTTKFLCSKFAHVHAFDFDNHVHECAKLNMKKFNVTNATFHPYGLGKDNKSVAITNVVQKLKRKTNGKIKRWAVVGDIGTHVDTKNQEDKTQNIKTLDSLNITNIGLMMIDTEGYELHVIKGARETIARDKPVIVCEYHKGKKLTRRYGYYARDITEYLRELGYKSIGHINRADKLFVHEGVQ